MADSRSPSKAAAPSAHGNPRRAGVLAQDPHALKETQSSSLEHDTIVEHGARSERNPPPSSDSDDDHEDDQSSWLLDPSIPASTTLNACFNLINASEKSALSIISSIPHLLNAAYHLFVLILSAVFLAILSHVFLPRTLWQRGGAPRRLSWPIRRSHNWSLRETASVAVVSHLLPAFLSLSKTRFCPSAERLIPALSRRLFGVKHQGWTIEGVAIQLKGDERCRIRLGDTDHEAKMSLPTPVLLWKSHARNVSHHQITSFKPSISCGGIGGGQARSRHERVLLLLSGSSYVDRDPIAGLMACNLVNLTGLRCLCVNWRRPSSNHPTDHKQRGFPAGLNDALQAYLHLTKVMKFRPENVTLVGEGSGAGVAMGLMVWLSALQLQIESTSDKNQQAYGKPGKVVLWTPWCDLTMQSPTWEQNGSFDIVSCKEAAAARDAYVASLGLTGGASDKPGSNSSTSSQSKQHTPTHSYMKRKQSSQGSDSGLEIDSRPGSPSYGSSPRKSSLLTSPISTLLNSTTSTEPAQEPHSVWSMGEGVDFLFGKDKSEIQQHYADKLSQSPSSATEILMNSLPALGLDHPLLSPGLPCGREANIPHRPLNARVLELLHTPSARRRATQTQFLIFCGRDSVVWGEAASLASNLSRAEPNEKSQNVTFLSSLDTPTMFNLLPSIFLPQAQARADEVLKEWLLGDVQE